MEVEYWEVNENSVKDIMDIFLRLFVPERKVLSKYKPIKWCAIKEKALPVTKARFDSKVKGAIQHKIHVEDQLAELENEDTPTDVLQDADYDTTSRKLFWVTKKHTIFAFCSHSFLDENPFNLFNREFFF